jgi:hypothetical protein
MTARELLSLPERVLVMLGRHAEMNAMLEAAAMLAGATGARLAGLYLEDQELLDLAGLPPATVVARGAAAPLSAGTMEQALKGQARTCRRLMAEFARRAHLAYEFESVRGDRLTFLAGSTLKGDILVFQASLGGPGPREIVASVRRTAGAAAGVALVGPTTRRRSGPVVAIDDGDAMGERTVGFAARLARGRKESLMVIALAADQARAEEIIARARRIAGRDVTVTGIAGIGWGVGRLAESLGDIAPACVVGDLEGRPFVDDEAADILVRAARAPVVLLRPAAM